jgi:hypothetical protein
MLLIARCLPFCGNEIFSRLVINYSLYAHVEKQSACRYVSKGGKLKFLNLFLFKIFKIHFLLKKEIFVKKSLQF